MIRYGFNIKTRSGQRVDNISIVAANQSDAERRLRQMYHQCQIVECHAATVGRRSTPIELDNVFSIMGGETLGVPTIARSMLRNKASPH